MLIYRNAGTFLKAFTGYMSSNIIVCRIAKHYGEIICFEFFASVIVGKYAGNIRYICILNKLNDDSLKLLKSTLQLYHRSNIQ